MSSTSENFELKQAANQTRMIAIANSSRILADCFWEPRLPGSEAWELLALASLDLGGQAPEMASAARAYASELDPDQLPVLFSELFIGPFKVLAPPYGATYLDGDPSDAGRTQAEALGYYHQAGLVLPPHAGETPDHISVELEFIYFLMVRSIQEDALDCVDMAAQFSAHHLGRWLPLFAKQLQLPEEAKFYQTLCQLALLLVQSTRSL